MPVSWRVSFWKLRSNIQAFTWFYAGWEIWIQFQIWIFCMWISSFPVLTVEESPFPQWIFLLYLPTIRCCVHSLLGSLLYSVDLYVFVLLQCYFCYYSSAVYFKIKHCDTSRIALFVQVCFVYLESFVLPYEFYKFFPSFMKNVFETLIGITLNL